MRRSRYSDSQIMAILRQNQEGVSVPELCREHGVSSAQFYKWRTKYGGMVASMMKRLRELEEENSSLKKMYAEEKIKADIRDPLRQNSCSKNRARLVLRLECNYPHVGGVVTTHSPCNNSPKTSSR